MSYCVYSAGGRASSKAPWELMIRQARGRRGVTTMMMVGRSAAAVTSEPIIIYH